MGCILLQDKRTRVFLDLPLDLNRSLFDPADRNFAVGARLHNRKWRARETSVPSYARAASHQRRPPAPFVETTDSRRGAKQTAYEIRVASSSDALAKSKADVWDSGKVESDQSINVAYAGPELKSRQRYYWQVRVWDQQGNAQNIAWPPGGKWGFCPPVSGKRNGSRAICRWSAETTNPESSGSGRPTITGKPMRRPGNISFVSS